MLSLVGIEAGQKGERQIVLMKKIENYKHPNFASSRLFQIATVKEDVGTARVKLKWGNREAYTEFANELEGGEG